MKLSSMQHKDNPSVDTSSLINQFLASEENECINHNVSGITRIYLTIKFVIGQGSRVYALISL